MITTDTPAQRATLRQTLEPLTVPLPYMRKCIPATALAVTWDGDMEPMT